MPSIHPDSLSPFARASLALAQEFTDLSTLADQLSSTKLDSDNGLDESLKLLNRAAQTGEALAQAMQEFSTTLQEAREKAEASAKIVADRAQNIQQRRQAQGDLQEKMDRLKEEVKTLGATVASQPATIALTEDDKRKIAQELERLQEPMRKFIESAQAVKAEAGAKNFKRIERQADSMIDSLQASQRKIAQAIAPK
ncbi:MAG TPA: hypothetical protein VN915_06595 [Elusimicrobiota bacterium]|nr:hypothetical protein [Elusimicrobiota bacterium]